MTAGDLRLDPVSGPLGCLFLNASNTDKTCAHTHKHTMHTDTYRSTCMHIHTFTYIYTNKQNHQCGYDLLMNVNNVDANIMLVHDTNINQSTTDVLQIIY